MSNRTNPVKLLKFQSLVPYPSTDERRRIRRRVNILNPLEADDGPSQSVHADSGFVSTDNCKSKKLNFCTQKFIENFSILKVNWSPFNRIIPILQARAQSHHHQIRPPALRVRTPKCRQTLRRTMSPSVNTLKIRWIEQTSWTENCHIWTSETCPGEKFKFQC